MRLSKSRVVAGAACRRLLWLRVHAKDAPELQPTAAQLALFAAGHRVGDAAQRCLREAHGEDGVLIDGPTMPGGLTRMVDETRRAIDGGARVVFEASFVHDGVFVAVDALVKCDDVEDDASWVAVEVKGTARVKPEHVLDVATQLWVLNGAGIRVRGAEVMHMDADYRTTGSGASGSVECAAFARTDVLAEAAEREADVGDLVASLHSVLEGPMPTECGIGAGAVSGCVCEHVVAGIADRADDGPTTATADVDAIDDVRRLYRLGKKSKATLAAARVSQISRIPADFKLPPIAARQRDCVVRAVEAGRSDGASDAGLFIDRAAVLAELAQCALPAAFLDFEAINPALSPPRWAECAPFQQLPVQASLHTLRVHAAETAAATEAAEAEAEGGGALTLASAALERRVALRHDAFLAPSDCAARDPRPELAEWLLEACGDARTLLAYSASFESRAIEQLAQRASNATVATELRALATRVVDLLPIVRKHVYHPRFNGSFSLKSVLPALIPAAAAAGAASGSDGAPSYSALAVANGADAAAHLEALLLRGEPSDATARAKLRRELLEYCATDTLALVALSHRLRDLALAAV